MIFDVDRQTLDDLALFESVRQQRSVLNLFNKTATIGGREKLAEIFSRPLTVHHQIQDRIELLKYLGQHNLNLKLDRNRFDFVEFYLRKYYHKRSFSILTGFFEKIIFSFNNNNDYYVIQRGIESIIQIITELLKFAESLTGDLPKMLDEYRSEINNTFQGDDWGLVQSLKGQTSLKAVDIAKADHLFRSKAINQVKALLAIAYELDVYQSVNLSGKKLNFNLPVINTGNESGLIIKGLFHPFLKSPVPNDVDFNPEKNICFVTGTNMAGKSTLLKGIGIAVYLSQLGFPVPAAAMQTSVFNGLITTINLADDIENGQSHFYKEVLRIKYVAEKINSSGNIFVIFDELFRGTNVKDAYDASLAIISAFAKVKTCFFVVSTHIVEVANHLKSNKNISFMYMETTFKNAVPANSYLLKTGITEERLGMWIVNNEKILELIEKAVKS